MSAHWVKGPVCSALRLFLESVKLEKSLRARSDPTRSKSGPENLRHVSLEKNASLQSLERCCCRRRCLNVSSCWFNHLSFVPGKLAEQRWFNFATALLSRVSCISVKQQELLTKSCMLNKITFRQSASSAGDPYLGSGSSFHGVFFGQIIFKHSQIMLLGLIKKNIWSFPVWKIRNVIFEGFHLYKVDVLNSNLVGWLIRRKEKKNKKITIQWISLSCTV